MKKLVKTFLVMAAVVAVILGGGWMITSRNNTDKLPTPTGIPAVTNGWQEYRNEITGMAFRYPGHSQIREDEDGLVSITRIGKTQAEGTELYDGYGLTIRTGNLTGESLYDFVIKEQELAREQNPMGDPGAVSEIFPVALGKMSGWQFTSEGLGVYTVMFFDLGEGEYLRVDKLVEDPEGVGYEEEIMAILKSLRYKGEGVILE